MEVSAGERAAGIRAVAQIEGMRRLWRGNRGSFAEGANQIAAESAVAEWAKQAVVGVSHGSAQTIGFDRAGEALAE